MAYAERTRRPPQTLTDREVKRILKVTGEAKDGFRDHVIISLALGCGLRESEIAALNIGDVASDSNIRKPRRIIQLKIFKRAGKGPGSDPKFQRVHLPDATFYKLEKYLRHLDHLDDSRRPYALFLSQKGNRLSVRRLHEAWREWQIRAGFDVLYSFHKLRHTAISNVRRQTGDIRIAQKFARHVNIATTTIYDHPSDEEIAGAVKDLVA